METTSGAVVGAAGEGGATRRPVSAFLGVPFARARRFEAPRPPEPWAGERDAIAFGAVAPQPPGGTFEPTGLTQSEDCLSLNVWAPTGASGRPVMVWFHGGAFRHGSTASPLYHGSTLAADGDVVVVSAAYRLGVLGFLAHPALADADGATGNFGLLDQIEALRWVRDNAAAFGGDPSNVTIFGESAGAVSVLCLCASPLARGLFHKAVAQSPADLTLTPDVASEKAEQLASEAGVGVAALRRLEVGQILAAQTRVDGTGTTVAFTPCIDGRVLPDSPERSLKAGSAADVPLLVGSNVDEWKLWATGDPRSRDLDADGLTRRVERVLPGASSEVIEVFRAARQDRGEGIRPNDIWYAVESERLFRLPTLRAADAHHSAGGTAHTYLFGWGSPAMGGWLGACHGVEIAFVFGTQGRGDLAAFTGSGPAADALSAQVLASWAAFAHTADPATAALPWPRHDPGPRPTVVLDRACATALAPREPERALIDRLVPA